ncbi:MAG: hypothetical protein ACOCUS_01555 [Polyangiales bacterium]
MEADWEAELAQARHRRFVGRARELSSFRQFVADEQLRLLHVHGPGGVGKSTLLLEWLAIAREQRLQVLALDGRELTVSTDAVREAIGDANGTDVVAIDGFEHLAAFEGWLREVLFPELPTATKVVIAGRTPLSARWFLDPGWRALVRTLALANFDDAESMEYLEHRGIPEEQRADIVRYTRGHPLALGLCADLVLKDDAGTFSREMVRHAIGTVLRGVVDDAPSPLHRNVLHAAALVRVLTAPLLSHMLDREDVYSLLEWLRDRPFIEITPQGATMHDVVREAIVDELDWRDPALRNQMLDRAVGHYVGEISAAPGPRAEQTVFDLFYCMRRESGGRRMRLGQWGDHYSDRVRDDEISFLVETVERHEGRESAELAAWWMDRARDGVVAFRDSEQMLVGFAHMVDVDPADAEARARDPVVEALLSALDGRAPLRPGERGRLCRFWMDVAAHQGVSPIQTRLFTLMTYKLAFEPGGTVSAAVHVDPDEWLTRDDLTHEPFARVELGGVSFGVFGHDWRREAPMTWLARYVRVLRGADVAQPPSSVRPAIVLLGHEEFSSAVRQAFKHYHRADRLAESPLVSAPLVTRLGVEPGSDRAIDALRRVLAESCRALGERGTDELHRRVLERTFLQGADKQLAAASDLGMAYSTYRRHLSEALARVTQRLWEREIALQPRSNGTPVAS